MPQERAISYLIANTTYDQIDGEAVGYPLGPLLANIFLSHFEEKWVGSNNTHPSIWFRYVDDTFT